MYGVAAEANSVLQRLGLPKRPAYLISIKLPSDPRLHVDGDIVGSLAVFRTGIKYSQFLAGHDAVVQQVTLLDKALRDIFSDVLVLRFDEYLYETWAADKAEDWQEDPATCEAFLTWLCRQETLHWAALTRSGILPNSG